MNLPPKRYLALAAIVLLAAYLLFMPESREQQTPPAPSTVKEEWQGAPDQQIPGPVSESPQDRTVPQVVRESSEEDLAGVERSLSMTDLERKTRGMSAKKIKEMLSSDLSSVERNYLEQLLAGMNDEAIDPMLEEMMEDGFLDLSLDGDELTEEEGAGFFEAATNRMNSAIRVAGLRDNTAAVGKIIDIATHTNADESTLRASYEALGYLGTGAAIDFLKSELDSQQNPYLQSEIILSLSSAGSTAGIDTYLAYLKSPDTDLRNSAIVALGTAGEERAVDPFGEMFQTTDYSSQVLIVQALRKIDTASARQLLEKLAESHPDLAGDGSN